MNREEVYLGKKDYSSLIKKKVAIVRNFADKKIFYPNKKARSRKRKEDKVTRAKD